ncbi:factor-independent urate hydroxylase [Lichenicoccus sp.]|uniref:factor-independent urate hydroxylase n=1 Tax=Lichenicoccus sp. TaxID=2781899 RepID=UPI003D0E6C09
MPLVRNSYGKGRVRVMRVHRDGDYNEVRELTVHTMLEGDFAAAYTEADNRQVIATDTIKNMSYVIAREAMTDSAEQYGERLARGFLERYAQVERATVTMHETKWLRASFGGRPHPHGFVLDNNGRCYARVEATREAVSVTSGITGYTFMKSTGSGWENFVRDEYTTLPDTSDRIAATAMDATWRWSRVPADCPATNAAILGTMLEVFATTYSHSVQDSLWRMGEAALAACPALEEVRLACPNKHYLPVNLAPFGLSSDNMVFIPTDEPYGQIECIVGRS